MNIEQAIADILRRVGTSDEINRWFPHDYQLARAVSHIYSLIVDDIEEYAANVLAGSDFGAAPYLPEPCEECGSVLGKI